LSEVNLPELMVYYYEFFRLQANNKGLSFSLTRFVSEPEPIIRVDKNKLDGVLTNLIKNAIKFTTIGSVEFGCSLEGDDLVFYVSDTGIGIPADRAEAIFSRFVQAELTVVREHEGSGLGLSIVKEYIDMMNGKIWVTSEVQKGSTFYFSIPYIPVKTGVNRTNESNDSSGTFNRNITILIAEDDSVGFLYLETILKNEGFKLIHTINGADTVDVVRDNPSVSLVLMDIRMPVMDGKEATKQIRKFNKKIPIIAQTAFALSGDREDAIGAGCNDYLSKPFTHEQLIRMIRKYVRKKPK
jgi:CheY-like chemotaxis protein